MNKYFLYLIPISVIIIYIFFLDIPVPPKSLHEKARKALHQAKLVRADMLAKDSFNEAQMLLDSAMIEWKKENAKFIVFRDYSLMVSQLEKSLLASDLASLLAKEQKKKHNDKFELRIDTLKKMFAYYDRYLMKIPLNSNDMKSMTLARFQLDECILSIKNNRTEGIDLKLDLVEETIEILSQKSKEVIITYFEDYTKWEELKKKAIGNAKKSNTHVIIVDKLNRLCLVYKGDNLQSIFNAEFGSNWIGDKKLAGDKTTPEGEYKIVSKKEGGQTKYHKAFLLNYPNDDDLKRHKMNKLNGVIPYNARIGGDIEIHGMGGRRINWTDGCIALSNEDMNKIYRIVTIGTPVIIVGSTKPLKEVMGK